MIVLVISSSFPTDYVGITCKPRIEAISRCFESARTPSFGPYKSDPSAVTHPILMGSSS